MKKKRLIILLLTLALLPLSSVSVMARTINFNVGYEDPQNTMDDDKRTLTPCDGCVLRLVDENENVVYSIVIPTGATSLVLPSYLSGDYEIQIVQGNIYYYGNIYL